MFSWKGGEGGRGELVCRKLMRCWHLLTEGAVIGVKTLISPLFGDRSPSPFPLNCEYKFNELSTSCNKQHYLVEMKNKKGYKIKKNIVFASFHYTDQNIFRPPAVNIVFYSFLFRTGTCRYHGYVTIRFVFCYFVFYQFCKYTAP